ncbi:putative hem oxygenase [Plasmopara halstedii]
MKNPQLLTEQMRAATSEIHNISDNLINVKLVIALTDKQLYGRALMLFYFLYVQLEAVIRKHKDHEAFCGLNDILSKIATADGIAKDLRFYLGEDWNFTNQPTQAVHDYIKHLKELKEKNPVLVLPYCYHMYMAMLAGGMMIKKLVRRSFALPEGKGLHCSTFDVKSNKVRKCVPLGFFYIWQKLGHFFCSPYDFSLNYLEYLCFTITHYKAYASHGVPTSLTDLHPRSDSNQYSSQHYFY